MNRFLKTVSVAALALSLAACGLSPEERMNRAEQAFAENRFTEARLDLASVLQEDQGNAAALELLARTQLQLGDGEGAASTLARLERTGAVLGDFDALLAEATLLRGRFEEALTAGNELGTAEGARIAALAHIGLGDGEAALEAFERGRTLEGDKSRLLSDLAIFTMEAGDPDAAARIAAEARQLSPDGLDPLLASARVSQALGNLTAALGYYEDAVERWPESRMAILGRIGILGDLGRLDEARPLIADVADRIPGDPDITYLQARLAAEDGEWGEVRDLLQPLETRDDNRQQLLYSRALVELDLHEQAMPRLATILRRSPQNAAARRLLARAQLDGGNASGAFATIRPLALTAQGAPEDVAIYRAAAKKAGRSPDLDRALREAPPAQRVGTLLAEGDGALRRENWRAAIVAYEELRGWTGDSNAMVLNNLAYARSRTGDPAEALRLAEIALDLEPEHPSIMDTVGWLLVQSGRDRSRGILLLERAAARAPENRTIAEHLRRARNG